MSAGTVTPGGGMRALGETDTTGGPVPLGSPYALTGDPGDSPGYLAALDRCPDGDCEIRPRAGDAGDAPPALPARVPGASAGERDLPRRPVYWSGPGSPGAPATRCAELTPELLGEVLAGLRALPGAPAVPPARGREPLFDAAVTAHYGTGPQGAPGPPAAPGPAAPLAEDSTFVRDLLQEMAADAADHAMRAAMRPDADFARAVAKAALYARLGNLMGDAAGDRGAVLALLDEGWRAA